MTVKVVRALRPKEAISAENFQKLWLEEIGPHVASLQTSLGLVKYIQVHRSKGDHDNAVRSNRPNLVSPEPPFDIVEELYFDGDITQFTTTYHSEQGSKAWRSLIDIGNPYLNISQSHIYVVEERPFVSPCSPDNLIASEYNQVWKILAFIGVTEGAKSIEHWGQCHSTLVNRWASPLGILKYVQNHLLHPSVLDNLAQASGFIKNPSDICAIVWYGPGIQNDSTLKRARQEIRNDEDSFLGGSSMVSFVGKEHIFVDKYRC